MTHKENFDRNDLKEIENSRSLQEAIEKARKVLYKCHPSVSEHGMNPHKYSKIDFEIVNARNVQKVIEIMWNLLLSGEKLAVVGSKYQEKYT